MGITYCMTRYENHLMVYELKEILLENEREHK